MKSGLHNETGLELPGIRVRAVPVFVAADDFAYGYHIWIALIENLARIGCTWFRMTREYLSKTPSCVDRFKMILNVLYFLNEISHCYCLVTFIRNGS